MSQPKLLIIAYYFPPYRGVGGFRAAGMHRFLPDFGWQTHVVTATPGSEPDAAANVTRLPLLSGSRRRFELIRDDSGAWADQIKPRLAELIAAEKPDLVLITGGPFMYFKLGPWLRKHFNLPYILDLRDPFINPRFGRRWLRNTVARWFETGWYARAAAVLIPTDAMRGMVQAPARVPVHVIENGFDDRAFSGVGAAREASPDGELTLVYAGKFYDQAYPMQLLRVLERHEAFGLPKARMIHIGQTPAAIADEARAEGLPLEMRGEMPYAETIKEIERQGIGVILSGGLAFEVTTKIYDYIALNKPILGIGLAEGGGAHLVLRRYGNYRLCANNEDDIAAALRALLAHLPRHPALPEAERETFGRRFQAKQLASLLDRMVAKEPSATVAGR